MPFYGIFSGLPFALSALPVALRLCQCLSLLCGCPFCLLPVALPAGRAVIVTVCFRQGFVILCCQVEHAHWQLPTVCRQLGSSSLEFREPGSLGRLTWVCKPTVGYTPISSPVPSPTPMPIPIPNQSTVGRAANYTFWRQAQCVRRARTTALGLGWGWGWGWGWG